MSEVYTNPVAIASGRSFCDPLTVMSISFVPPRAPMLRFAGVWVELLLYGSIPDGSAPISTLPIAASCGRQPDGHSLLVTAKIVSRGSIVEDASFLSLNIVSTSARVMPPIKRTRPPWERKFPNSDRAPNAAAEITPTATCLAIPSATFNSPLRASLDSTYRASGESQWLEAVHARVLAGYLPRSHQWWSLYQRGLISPAIDRQ